MFPDFIENTVILFTERRAGESAASVVTTLRLQIAGMAAAAESTLPLDALYKQMERLLAKQKAVSDELHHMLTDKSTGLCENTRLTLKNLDAAVRTRTLILRGRL